MTEAISAGILGWRKLGAWFLVFALGAYVSIDVVGHNNGADIPDNVLELIKWVTGFFFGANAIVHIAKEIGVKVVKE